jgi:hypothetical protein
VRDLQLQVEAADPNWCADAQPARVAHKRRAHGARGACNEYVQEHLLATALLRKRRAIQVPSLTAPLQPEACFGS